MLWQFTSHLRPPSKIVSPGRLFEMSASATNARTTAMPPPQSMNTLKRKTLAERAGEPPGRPAPAPPSSRPVNGYLKTTTIAGASRDSSLSSSVSSRQTSGASNTSYSSSIATRPPSAQLHRPQSAMAAHSRIQKFVSTRPATSLEVHEEESGKARALGRRKGRTPLSLCPNPPEYPTTLQSPKLRGCSIRYFSMNSLNTKFNTLSLKSGQTQSTPKVDVDIPATPSQIPKFVPQNALPAETPSPSKSPKKTPRSRPPLPLYLNRASNDVIAWDTDSRLEEVENMCSEFKEKMDGATTESKSLKEIIGVYKIRSGSCSLSSQNYPRLTGLVTELESIRTSLTTSNTALQIDLDAIKIRVAETSEALDDAKRYGSTILLILQQMW